jgi:hypothetical protein
MFLNAQNNILRAEILSCTFMKKATFLKNKVKRTPVTLFMKYIAKQY